MACGRYRSARNWSTERLACRIRARRVPRDSSLCWGTDRFARWPGLTSTTWLPTWPRRRQPGRSNAAAAARSEMLASPPMARSDGDNDGFVASVGRERFDGLPIFCPQLGGDGFPDVLKGFLLILALGDTAWKRGTLGDDPAVLGMIERNVEEHSEPPFPASSLADPARGRRGRADPSRDGRTGAAGGALVPDRVPRRRLGAATAGDETGGEWAGIDRRQRRSPPGTRLAPRGEGRVRGRGSDACAALRGAPPSPRPSPGGRRGRGTDLSQSMPASFLSMCLASDSLVSVWRGTGCATLVRGSGTSRVSHRAV